MTRVLCTGNPNKKTLAWAALQKWPGSDSISLSSGWDLRLSTAQDLVKFQQKISEHNIFINGCYVSPGTQSRLLQIVVEQWMYLSIRGHVFNIGTTLEQQNNHDSSTDAYVKSKLTLRQKSLDFNEQTGITGVKCTYLILGGVNNQEPDTHDYVDPLNIFKVIDWVLQFPDRIGLVQIDKAK